jgi:6-pyruvoyltetrahydropterin/6-carboxytetrahydropterin synthase
LTKFRGVKGADISFRVALEKENFKFSSSHFTIFAKDRAERLHGHNYYAECILWLDSIDPELGLAFDFNLVKPMVREITEHLDEYVLIPEKSPFLKVKIEGSSVRVEFSGKTYVLPSEDVRLLPIVNITAEELSRYMAGLLLERLKAHPSALARIDQIAVGIQETRGQTVLYHVDLRAKKA